jgi:hypothetical protein
MLPFFAELVSRTDEDRRAFETHPVVVAAVADGMSVERYRALLLELYHVVWHFNPVCAAAASRLASAGTDATGGALQRIRHFLYEHMHEEAGHETWVMNDLQAVGVAPAATLALASATRVGRAGPELLFGFVFLLGAARAFEMPASQSLLPTLVPA